MEEKEKYENEINKLK